MRVRVHTETNVQRRGEPDSGIPNMGNVRFSVVIPLYNKERSILRTIESVLRQTFSDFELVVVNDGSTDSSLDVVRKIKDPRIRIIDKQNGGVSSARNRGIKESKSDWIALLDGDDLWLPNHLENLVKAIGIFPQHKVFYTGWARGVDKCVDSGVTEFAVEVDNYFRFALSGYGMWTSCVCFHSSVQTRMLMFSEALTHGEDVELWVRMAKTFSPVFVREVSSIYLTTIDENAMSKIPHPANVAIFSSQFDGRINSFERIYHTRRLISAVLRCGRKYPIATLFYAGKACFRKPSLYIRGCIELFFWLWK